MARQGQREAAKRQQAKDLEIKREALLAEMNLADLRKNAIEMGVDPDIVVAGYEALRDGQVSPESVIDTMRQGEVGG